MTKLNNETRELTLSELDAASGGLGAFGFGVLINLATDALKGEVNGEGFVAQASKAAQAQIK
jgi:hypothetical protein